MSWNYPDNFGLYNYDCGFDYSEIRNGNEENAYPYEFVPLATEVFYNSENTRSQNWYQMADITHSQLQPTAKEFTPSANRSAGAGTSDNSNHHLGAIKKSSSKDKYGSRYVNSKFKSKREGKYSYYERSGTSRNNHLDNVPETSYQANEGSRSKQYVNRKQPYRGYQNSRVPYEGHATHYSPNYCNGYDVVQSETYNSSTDNRERNDSSSKNDYRYKHRYDVKAYDKHNNHSNSWRRGNSEKAINNDNQTQRQENSYNWRYEQQDDKVQIGEYSKKMNASSRREQLEELIWRRKLECLVCCERLRHQDKIWSCKQCFHILHTKCVRQWAESSKLDTGWRCPACQNIYTEIPSVYQCFCGKIENPSISPGILPHSCGEVCGRSGRFCDHKCTLLCHPGPCPECDVIVSRKCGCGSTEFTMACSSTAVVSCKNVCNKLLECGLHSCSAVCHPGPCDPCSEYLKQECFCGKQGRRVRCTKEFKGATRYKCGERCEKMLLCGNHKCQLDCHDGPCEDCSLMPEVVKFCPCGQSVLNDTRTSCLDPVPCCDKICGKKLNCGQPGNPHLCQSKCHEGSCPPCPLTTMVRCRCGHMDKEILCVNLTTKADDARCEKKCVKKRLCGKHKCNQRCCIEIEHICPLPCNRLLSCGLHRCPLTCHSGKCPPCLETSFEELYCECRACVIYPPVACGTRPPKCNKPCPRPRPCGHDVNHNCHTGLCPPCTVLCKRWCYGKHEQRSAIPCHRENFSCGLPCGKLLSCGRHKCIKLCHSGDCPTECTQPCREERTTCEHVCGAPCHEPPCPDTPCKQVVRVLCQCGLRSATRICMDLIGEYQTMAVAGLVSKMAELQTESSVDISDFVNNPKKLTGPFRILDCIEECRLVERNRRLAIGLQIRNPDLSSKLTPRYSDNMRGWAKKDPRFCQRVHEKLTELVQLAKQSKQKSRSYSFESMNRDKRHFVHDYCEHFGCDSAAYDKEPNRNVVATAFRDKSWLPSVSLLELIQRENGQRKVPGPILSKGSFARDEPVSLRLPGRNVQRPVTPPGEYNDCFDGSF